MQLLPTQEGSLRGHLVTVAGCMMKLRGRTRRLGYIHKPQPTGFYCREVDVILAVAGKFSEVPHPPPPQRQKDGN
jgi:hypothetical protein